jgi:prepilin-type N-terminal cleavage/methylation domain-containing protein
MTHRSAFTLIELLVVIGIIAILSIVVVLVLNPSQILMQGRDSNRVADMASMTEALSVYAAGGGTSFGSGNVVYVSIPDPMATSTAGDQCQGLGLPVLPSTYTYQCSSPANYRNVDGTGWIPVNFKSISAGSPLSQLPIDPINTSSSRNYYTYDTNGSQYEVTAPMESQKYGLGGSNDVIGNDGGTLATVYEKGTKVGLEPLDYGDNSLVGYWTLDEGTGSVAYDYSGNNATGSWNGAQAGTNGYYSSGHNQLWAGAFASTSTLTVVTSTWPASLDPSGIWSVSLWSYTGIGQNTYPGLWGVGPSGNYTLYYTNSSGNACIWWVTACIGSSSIPVDFGAWDMWVVTRNGTTFSVFKNGSLMSVGTKSGTTGLTTFYIGSQGISNNNGQYFNGLIDDVRVYNRALTAAQIAAMYAGGK